MVALPNAIIPHEDIVPHSIKKTIKKILFRTVLHLARHGGAYKQLGPLLRLQVCNGIKDELWYHHTYVPIILKYLGTVARKYLR